MQDTFVKKFLTNFPAQTLLGTKPGRGIPNTDLLLLDELFHEVGKLPEWEMIAKNFRL